MKYRKKHGTKFDTIFLQLPLAIGKGNRSGPLEEVRSISTCKLKYPHLEQTLFFKPTIFQNTIQEKH